MGEPAISLHSYTVSLVQWVNPLLPAMRNQGSIPRGVLTRNRDSPVSVVSLQEYVDVDSNSQVCLTRATAHGVDEFQRIECVIGREEGV
jgi:hypothetical protein